MKNNFTRALLSTLLFTAFLAWMSPVEAQTTVTIGTGTTPNPSGSMADYPAAYGQYYTGARYQILVPASEIIAAGGSGGYISSLSFNVTTPAPPSTTSQQNLKNFTIKIGTTLQDSITSFQSGLTQVYTVPSFISQAGINTHTFNNNFFWDGISNIIIETCFDNYVSSGDYSSNSVGFTSATSYKSVIVYYSDGGSVCGNSAVSLGYYYRHNMSLSILPPFTLDAGISAINSPVAPASSRK
jgi:hypothetical protein